MKYKVISAFPCLGKSHMFNNPNGLKVLDSDSSSYSWVYVNNEKVRNPDFPNNYIEHIKKSIDDETIDYILVSSHKNVRDALIENNIPFVIFLPKSDNQTKTAFIKRCINRGSPPEFIDMIDKNWIQFTDINEYVYPDDYPVNIVQVYADEYLSDYVSKDGIIVQKSKYSNIFTPDFYETYQLKTFINDQQAILKYPDFYNSLIVNVTKRFGITHYHFADDN